MNLRKQEDQTLKEIRTTLRKNKGENLKKSVNCSLYLGGKFAYFSSVRGRGCSGCVYWGQGESNVASKCHYCGKSTRVYSAPPHSLHKQPQLLARCTHFLCRRKAGGCSCNNEIAPHRLLDTGHKVRDWQGGMQREASWKPQGAAGNTEFTESKGDFNQELWEAC